MLARSYLLVLLALAGCPAPGTPSVPVHYWNVRAIPANVPDIVELRGPNPVAGQPYAIAVPRAHIELLRQVTDRMSATASVPVDWLLISDEIQWTARARRSDGKTAIVVTIRMLHVVDGDEAALAAVVGHELGHLALGHVSLQTLDVTQIDVTPFSQRQEREADAYGIRLAKKAGYDPRGTERMIRKLTAANPRLTKYYLDTHPSPQERIDEMHRLVKELEAQ